MEAERHLNSDFDKFIVVGKNGKKQVWCTPHISETYTDHRRSLSAISAIFYSSVSPDADLYTAFLSKLSISLISKPSHKLAMTDHQPIIIASVYLLLSKTLLSGDWEKLLNLGLAVMSQTYWQLAKALKSDTVATMPPLSRNNIPPAFDDDEKAESV
ncbi:hypothetical protein EVAR_100466_1 [Eumeta japonica]|uniref:Uncharacterized protein n=1 Tax=Eumeta variegata TaxID=151549 RepID=A0A4C2A577_EUMVA|nr:hypothetical protein EVAR_100466_1 [Eumeta japonica]